MPTVGEVYGPLVDAAMHDDEAGRERLNELGETLYAKHRPACRSVEEGIEQAKHNLDYFCQYYSDDVAKRVKAFYGLGEGFRALSGQKIGVPA